MKGIHLFEYLDNNKNRMKSPSVMRTGKKADTLQTVNR